MALYSVRIKERNFERIAIEMSFSIVSVIVVSIKKLAKTYIYT